jgi:hypothetical protein
MWQVYGKLIIRKQRIHDQAKFANKNSILNDTDQQYFSKFLVLLFTNCFNHDIRKESFSNVCRSKASCISFFV